MRGPCINFHLYTGLWPCTAMTYSGSLSDCRRWWPESLCNYRPLLSPTGYLLTRKMIDEDIAEIWINRLSERGGGKAPPGMKDCFSDLEVEPHLQCCFLGPPVQGPVRGLVLLECEWGGVYRGNPSP